MYLLHSLYFHPSKELSCKRGDESCFPRSFFLLLIIAFVRCITSFYDFSSTQSDHIYTQVKGIAMVLMSFITGKGIIDVDYHILVHHGSPHGLHIHIHGFSFALLSGIVCGLCVFYKLLSIFCFFFNRGLSLRVSTSDEKSLQNVLKRGLIRCPLLRVETNKFVAAVLHFQHCFKIRPIFKSFATCSIRNINTMNFLYGNCKLVR